MVINQKHILIIGGMGPQASLYAHKRLIEEYQKAKVRADNSIYPRITHLSINVEDFISDPSKKDSALRYIVKCLRDIDMRSVDTGFIACNTAHLLFDKIQESANGKLISMVDAAKDDIAPNQVVGILATPLTINTNLYNLKNVIKPDDKDLDSIESIIREVIASGPNLELANRLKTEADKLAARGADKIILGCSELSILGSLLTVTNVIDPVGIVIKKIMDIE